MKSDRKQERDRQKMNLKLYRTQLLLCASVFMILIIASCKSGPPPATSTAQRYEFKGKVVTAERGNHTVTIDHEAIPGYMGAMTMQFMLYEDWVYTELTPGALIQATLVVDNGKSWLENPTVTKIANPNLTVKNE